jgi:hypothetical protein
VRPPFRLEVVNGNVSTDTIECIRALLARAEAGEVIGVAFAAMHKQRRYTVHTCGEAHRNPTFCRGMIAALDDALAERVAG